MQRLGVETERHLRNITTSAIVAVVSGIGFSSCHASTAGHPKARLENETDVLQA